MVDEWLVNEQFSKTQCFWRIVRSLTIHQTFTNHSSIPQPFINYSSTIRQLFIKVSRLFFRVPHFSSTFGGLERGDQTGRPRSTSASRPTWGRPCECGARPQSRLRQSESLIRHETQESPGTSNPLRGQFPNHLVLVARAPSVGSRHKSRPGKCSIQQEKSNFVSRASRGCVEFGSLGVFTPGLRIRVLRWVRRFNGFSN